MLVTTLVHKSPARERANAWTGDRSQDMSYSSYNVVAVQLLSLQLRLKKNDTCVSGCLNFSLVAGSRSKRRASEGKLTLHIVKRGFMKSLSPQQERFY